MPTPPFSPLMRILKTKGFLTSRKEDALCLRSKVDRDTAARKAVHQLYRSFLAVRRVSWC